MKFDTLSKKTPYLAEYWSWTINPADTTGTLIYAFNRNVPINLAFDGSGRIYLFTDDAAIQKNGQIRKITRASDGQLITDRWYYISVQEIILMPLDKSVSYKYWGLETAVS